MTVNIDNERMFMAIILCKVLPEHTTMLAIISHPYRVSSLYSYIKLSISSFFNLVSDWFSVSADTQSPEIGIWYRGGNNGIGTSLRMLATAMLPCLRQRQQQ